MSDPRFVSFLLACVLFSFVFETLASCISPHSAARFWSPFNSFLASHQYPFAGRFSCTPSYFSFNSHFFLPKSLWYYNRTFFLLLCSSSICVGKPFAMVLLLPHPATAIATCRHLPSPLFTVPFVFSFSNPSMHVHMV